MTPGAEASQTSLAKELTSALRDEIRTIVSKTLERQPEQVLILIPRPKLTCLKDVPEPIREEAFRRLEGYVGAALTDTARGIDIPFSYRLYPRQSYGGVEVLVGYNEELQRPSRHGAYRLAEDYAAFISQSMMMYDVGEINEFPMLSSVKDLNRRHELPYQAHFYFSLAEHLGRLGLSVDHPESKSYYSVQVVAHPG